MACLAPVMVSAGSFSTVGLSVHGDRLILRLYCVKGGHWVTGSVVLVDEKDAFFPFVAFD